MHNTLSKHEQRIAEKAAENALNRYSSENDEEEIINEDELEAAPLSSFNDIRTEVEKDELTDIFSQVGDPRLEAGDRVRYRIKKNKELMGYRHHPYSWEELQKEFGPGHYNVAAQSSVGKKHFIKHQPMTVGDVLKENKQVTIDKTPDLSLEILRQIQETSKEEAERRDRELKEERERIRQETREREAKMQQEQEKSNNLMTTIIQGMLNKPQDNREVASIREEIKNSNNTLTTVLLAMVQSFNTPKDNKDDKVVDMMLRLEEKREAREREDRIERERREEKRQSEFKELLNKVFDSREKEKDPFEYLKFYKDAVQEGFERYRTIEEIADEKAEAKSGGSSDDGSITASLIKNVAPLLTVIAQNSQNRPNLPAPVAPNPALPEQRRVVRPLPTGTPTSQIHERNQKEAGNSPEYGRSGGQNSGQTNLNVAQEQNSAIMEVDKAQELEQTRREIVQKIGPTLISCLMAENGPMKAKDSSGVCANTLIKENIDPVKAISIFSADDLLRIAGEAGLTDNNYPGIEGWLKEFYDNFKEEAGNAIRQHTQSQVSHAA